MLILGKDIIGKPIIHTDTPEPEIEPAIHDLLITNDTLTVSHVIFQEKTMQSLK
jgi:hypothetical protein